TAQRFRELERLELEAGDCAEREADHHLERRRRRQPGSDRQGRRERSPDGDLRATELAELRRDRIHVPLPALDVLGGRELGGVGRLAIEPYAAVDRGREDEAADEVGVLADQVDAAGREERPHAAYPCGNDKEVAPWRLHICLTRTHRTRTSATTRGECSLRRSA